MYRLWKELCVCLFGIAIVAAFPAAPITDDGKIVGGQNTTVKNHPYMLSLEYAGRHRCGSTLLTDRWALTAGHCVVSQSNFDLPVEDLDMRAGTDIRNSDGVLYELELYIKHEKFNYELLDYDICLLKAKTRIKFTPVIQPMGLPPQDDPLEDGQIVHVIGWGFIKEGGPHADILQEVELPVIGLKRCQELLQAPPIERNITDRVICAGYPEGERDACDGDSGGPMVSQEGFLVGIVSWGYGCARPNVPGEYTKVSYFSRWIEDVKRNNSDIEW